MTPVLSRDFCWSRRATPGGRDVRRHSESPLGRTVNPPSRPRARRVGPQPEGCCLLHCSGAARNTGSPAPGLGSWFLFSLLPVASLQPFLTPAGKGAPAGAMWISAGRRGRESGGHLEIQQGSHGTRALRKKPALSMGKWRVRKGGGSCRRKANPSPRRYLCPTRTVVKAIMFFFKAALKPEVGALGAAVPSHPVTQNDQAANKRCSARPETHLPPQLL